MCWFSKKKCLIFKLLGPIQNGSIFNQPEASCSRKCLSSQENAYEVGSTYEFKYESESITSMKGTSDQESKILVKADVLIEVWDTCDLRMKVEIW